MDKYETIGELFIRVFLFAYYWISSLLKPRQRDIHEEEWWLYMNPRTDSYFPFQIVLIIVFINLGTFAVTSKILNRSFQRNVYFASLLGYSLACLINSSITNTLKLMVGRPRPDFFFRCFPEGKKLLECNGEESIIIEGMKSFPSGHSSLCMAAFGYTTLFLIGQFRLFSKEEQNFDRSKDKSSVLSITDREQIRYVGMKFIICLLPFLLGLIISVSRLIDYHHHFEDIAVGATMGFIIGAVCYRLYFPSLWSSQSHLSKYSFIDSKYQRSTYTSKYNNNELDTV